MPSPLFYDVVVYETEWYRPNVSEWGGDWWCDCVSRARSLTQVCAACHVSHQITMHPRTIKAFGVDTQMFFPIPGTPSEPRATHPIVTVCVSACL